MSDGDAARKKFPYKDDILFEQINKRIAEYKPEEVFYIKKYREGTRLDSRLYA